MFQNKIKMVIFLGLIFSSLTIKYDWPIIPFILIVYGCSGIVTLHFKKARTAILKTIEWIVLLVALLAAVQMNLTFEPDYFIFISIGLVIYQLGRLHITLSEKEEKIALAVALVQLGLTARQTFEPISFLLLILLSLYFVPQAFYQIDAARFCTQKEKLKRPHPLTRNKRRTVAIIIVMLMIFILLPRFKLFDEWAGEDSGGEAALTETLDMSGRLSSQYFQNRLLFKVYAKKNVGYLKIDCLYDFDGRFWAQTRDSFKMDERRALNAEYQPSLLSRKVRLFTMNGIGISIPTDYYPTRLRLYQTHPVYVARHGAILAKPPIPSNFLYQYWSEKEPSVILLLSEEEKSELTDLGSFVPSQRLQDWLEKRIDLSLSGLQNARGLVQSFKQNFQYSLNAPSLDPESPMEDFMFNQKKGHCERYASALAVLLRMQGIPARVARGFVPREYNEFGKYYNVRAKDAHAWVEAWFEEKGWVTLDATPPGYGSRFGDANSLTAFYEYVSDLWQLEVVSFNQDSQQRLFLFSWKAIQRGGTIFLKNIRFVLVGILLVFFGFFVRRFHWHSFCLPSGQKKRDTAGIKASHFYAKLLKILNSQNYSKGLEQTPLEFLNELKRKNHPQFIAIHYITHQFCAVRYGNKILDDDEEREIAAQLKMLKG